MSITEQMKYLFHYVDLIKLSYFASTCLQNNFNSSLFSDLMYLDFNYQSVGVWTNVTKSEDDL
jgi:hypothetical protein